MKRGGETRVGQAGHRVHPTMGAASAVGVVVEHSPRTHVSLCSGPASAPFSGSLHLQLSLLVLSKFLTVQPNVNYCQ